jgi:hypothetical protein
MRIFAVALLSISLAGCGTHFAAAASPAEAVRTSYNKLRGVTNIRAAVVYRSFAPPHTVDLSTVFEGRERPAQIWDAVLTFSTARPMAREWQFRENHELVIVLDDGRPLRYTGFYEGVEGASIVTETVRFNVSLDDLRRIADAPVVRGRLGNQDFEWRERETAVVGHFLAALKE